MLDLDILDPRRIESEVLDNPCVSLNTKINICGVSVRTCATPKSNHKDVLEGLC